MRDLKAFRFQVQIHMSKHSFSQLPNANRPADLLVSLICSIFSHLISKKTQPFTSRPLFGATEFYLRPATCTVSCFFFGVGSMRSRPQSLLSLVSCGDRRHSLKRRAPTPQIRGVGRKLWARRGGGKGTPKKKNTEK